MEESNDTPGRSSPAGSAPRPVASGGPRPPRPWSIRLGAAGIVVLVSVAGCATTASGDRPNPHRRDRPTAPAPDLPAAGDFDPSTVPDAVPRLEPKSSYGNPASYEVLGRTYRVLDTSEGYVERGMASWYGADFHGKPTSSQEPYDMYGMTAAHTTLPLPTYVEVTNLDNGRRVVVRVNDRGPFHDGRIIDLSYAAALKLGIVGPGTAPVEVRALDPPARSGGPGF